MAGATRALLLFALPLLLLLLLPSTLGQPADPPKVTEGRATKPGDSDHISDPEDAARSSQTELAKNAHVQQELQKELVGLTDKMSKMKKLLAEPIKQRQAENKKHLKQIEEAVAIAVTDSLAAAPKVDMTEMATKIANLTKMHIADGRTRFPKAWTEGLAAQPGQPSFRAVRGGGAGGQGGARDSVRDAAAAAAARRALDLKGLRAWAVEQAAQADKAAQAVSGAKAAAPAAAGGDAAVEAGAAAGRPAEVNAAMNDLVGLPTSGRTAPLDAVANADRPLLARIVAGTSAAASSLPSSSSSPSSSPSSSSSSSSPSSSASSLASSSASTATVAERAATATTEADTSHAIEVAVGTAVSAQRAATAEKARRAKAKEDIAALAEHQKEEAEKDTREDRLIEAEARQEIVNEKGADAKKLSDVMASIGAGGGGDGGAVSGAGKRRRRRRR